jgi:type III restriction enzyme
MNRQVNAIANRLSLRPPQRESLAILDRITELISPSKEIDGRYASKVIQVDSSKSGAEEDQMIQRLLAVESTEEPTEIIVHVNRLKEGWDVTNLYTIIPLRAANAKTLIQKFDSDTERKMAIILDRESQK